MTPNDEVFPPITTSRLILPSSSLSLEKSILQGHESFQRLIPYRVPESWPGDDWIEALHSLIDLYDEHPDWCAWNRYLLHRGDQTFIGGIGCICPPQQDGAVTIGYSIIPEYRRQGYALEAVEAFIQWLRSQPAVKLIKADCLINNTPSIRILQRVGFMQVGMFDDEEGRKFQWEMTA